MNIEQIKKILTDGTLGYFATTNGEQLEVRGWQYQFTEDNKFYFATANTKDVYKQMKINPQVAFASVSNGHNVRISGKAIFIDAEGKKKYFTRLSEGVQSMYKSWDNPVVEIFYIERGEIKISEGYKPFETVRF